MMGYDSGDCPRMVENHSFKVNFFNINWTNVQTKPPLPALEWTQTVNERESIECNEKWKYLIFTLLCCFHCLHSVWHSLVSINLCGRAHCLNSNSHFKNKLKTSLHTLCMRHYYCCTNTIGENNKMPSHLFIFSI